MEINQSSFKGGMNLLVDDTRPTTSIVGNSSTGSVSPEINQYRIGFNVRCRYDVLEPTKSSSVDTAAPVGLKQGILSFGNYIVAFVAGYAYYRLYSSTGWKQIPGFSMNRDAPRYWAIAIPVSETNYGRTSNLVTSTQAGNVTGNPRGGVNTINLAGAFQGYVPGLLVQDGITQPQFIYLDSITGLPTTKTTQTYVQWTFTWDSTPTSATYGTVSVDKREYVPIGTYMELYNGILFITSIDGNYIYRSVSGRPLDFVVNVDINGQKGGDATTTSYSVGVGGISCLRNLSSGLFVCAGNACFMISLNTTQDAPTLFGEYTFLRTFLFNASCITDRGIVDINGDTAFIDLTGLRTFNSVLQEQNEGRNSVFSKTVSSLFTGIVQLPLAVATETFDNYALFAVNTTYGYVVIIYDTINDVYTSVDISQVSQKVGIKQFAAITTEVTAIYAITRDDQIIQLYSGGLSGLLYDTSYVRFMSFCSQDPSKQVKQKEFRAILSEVNQDSTASLTVFVDNRLSIEAEPKDIPYTNPNPSYNGNITFPDVNSQVSNLYWTTPDCRQGWKSFNLLSWSGGGKITNIKTTSTDNTPMNPLQSQS